MRYGRMLRMVMAGASLLAGCASAVLAQEPVSAFPSRNITLIVPQAAGGPPDVVARLVATPLSELIGKPVIIENRAGASASIGGQGRAGRLYAALHRYHGRGGAEPDCEGGLQSGD